MRLPARRIALARAYAASYTSNMKKYRLFDHTADIGLDICGRTQKELFAHAALAVTEVMISFKHPPVRPGRKKILTLEGSDPADLFVNFLREILYFFNGEKRIVQRCDILSCGRKHIVASLFLKRFNEKAHSVNKELKAVTYHGLSVKKVKNGWRARVIIDV